MNIEEIEDILRDKNKKIKHLQDEIDELRDAVNYLRLNNPERNLEHFRIVGENQRKIKNLRYANKKLLEKVDKLQKENEYLKRKIDLYY